MAYTYYRYFQTTRRNLLLIYIYESAFSTRTRVTEVWTISWSTNFRTIFLMSRVFTFRLFNEEVKHPFIFL